MKNTYIKFVKVSLVLCLLGFNQSCQDTLEEEVISAIPNAYISTPKGLEDAVSSAYTSMRVYYGTERGHNLGDFGTDTYTNGADGSFKFMNTYGTDFDSNVSHLRELWEEFYRGVNTANAILERSKDVTGLSDAVKNQRIAEAKFIRAHHFFILTQHFGGIDLRLTETVSPTKDAKRATIAAQYAAIIKDLTEAIPALDPKAKATQYGRATKAAGEMLLAKVYMAKAGSEAKASDDFAKAIPLLQSVVSNYGFKLLPDFADVYRPGNETNDEVIWSIQYTRDPLTNGGVNGGNSSHVFFLMEYDVLPGMQRDTENGRPFKRYRITPHVYNNIFDLASRDIDSRYKKTFIDTYRSNRPGTYNTSFDNSKPSVTFALGDTTIFLPGYEMPVAERAAKKYQVLVPSRYDERIFPAMRKHMDPARVDRTQFEGGRDYIVFRLADALLLLAECQMQTGNRAAAVQNINLVRERAAWPGKAADNRITDAQLNMEFIMDERTRELIGEGHRWLDLKRWGVLLQRTKQYNAQAAAMKDHHVLRPIPQIQIDRVEGGAPNFPQNPGY